MTRPSPSPALPAFVQPMLASRGTAFDDNTYLFEVKWNGIRMLAFLETSAQTPGPFLSIRKRAV